MPTHEPLYLTDNGFVNTKAEAVAIRNPEMVEMVEEWLKENSVASKKKYQHSSYKLKHVVEADLRTYITNGAFIQACMNVGYKVERSEGSLNGWIYADFPDNNLIKKACKTLGVNYRGLSELIGYGEGAIKNAASSGVISDPMQRAIELAIENHLLKTQNDKFKTIGSALNDLIFLSRS